MTKRNELANPRSPWNRTPMAEPVFVLCGRDALAPECIAFWCEKARRAGVGRKKIADAKRLLAEVKRYQKKWGSKIPD